MLYRVVAREQLLNSIRRITFGIAEAVGVPQDRKPIVSVRKEYTPSLYNDPELTDRLLPSI